MATVDVNFTTAGLLRESWQWLRTKLRTASIC